MALCVNVIFRSDTRARRRPRAAGGVVRAVSHPPVAAVRPRGTEPLTHRAADGNYVVLGGGISRATPRTLVRHHLDRNLIRPTAVRGANAASARACVLKTATLHAPIQNFSTPPPPPIEKFRTQAHNSARNIKLQNTYLTTLQL